MLTLVLPETEYYDDRTNRFFTIGETVLQLEHSLRAISKWEEIWQIPFLGRTKKTYAQLIDYIRCMTVNQEAPRIVYDSLTNEQIKQISNYMETPRTARKSATKQGGRNDVITCENIYYMLAANQIPFECQDWHLSKLLALLNVCASKSGKQKKMSKSEIIRRNAELNAQRRQQLNTTG